jgi:hypothetical protein
MALQSLLLADMHNAHWSVSLATWWEGPDGPTRQPGWEVAADISAPMEQRQLAFNAAVQYAHVHYLDQERQEVLRMEFGQRPVTEYCALLQFQRWIHTRQWHAEEAVGGDRARPRGPLARLDTQ